MMSNLMTESTFVASNLHWIVNITNTLYYLHKITYNVVIILQKMQLATILYYQCKLVNFYSY